MKLKAVIVEDSRLARNELKELLKQYKDIELLGEAPNVDEGVALIQATQPDLLFLDINMPEKDGFELLEMLDEAPMTIFTTAYDEYAIKSFEYNALDYLLKPINEKRFAKAIEKVQKQKTEPQSEVSISERKLQANSQIFIKDGDNCWMVKIAAIQLFEIVGNYTKVYFENNKPLIYKSLNQIEQKLPETLFFRANRQQIINLQHIQKVTPWFNGKLKVTVPCGQEIEISRRQSTEFKGRLSL